MAMENRNGQFYHGGGGGDSVLHSVIWKVRLIYKYKKIQIHIQK